MNRWYHFNFWGDEFRAGKTFFADDFDFYGVDWAALGMARAQSEWNNNSWFRAPQKRWEGSLEDVLNNAAGLPVFSARLRDALAVAGIGQHDVQYLPVKVYRYSGELVEGYAIVNIIARIAALDSEELPAERLEEMSRDVDDEAGHPDDEVGRPRVTAIRRHAVLCEPLRAHDIVRLEESLSTILVSSRFAEVFREGRFTGAMLQALETK